MDDRYANAERRKRIKKDDRLRSSFCMFQKRMSMLRGMPKV